MRTTFVITMALLLAGASAAWGQTYEQRPYHPQYGDNGYYGGYSAGTIAGSGLYGMGALARGVGEYNLYSAMAARELEEARTLAIQNYQMAVDNWLARRAAHRERVRAEMLTSQQVARIVEVSRPDRLTAAQYRPDSGKLTWPAALMGQELAEERAALEAVFAGRTSRDMGAGSAFYANVRQGTEQMLAGLREKLPELSSMEFIAAKKFLVGLKYEALSPATSTALAMK
jgi:hypothetical protein